ncbi:sugar phosphate isomerase/epimerase [Nitrospiraceae bacterium AH_259_D15_M11_P09]|nr:sugar phosphate isomerase/epimerase [Nitrospiraceae bacterium AH_259_D15_M11_P09]
MRQIFLSTTFHGTEPTKVDEVLRLLKGLDIDGVELGSTHSWQPDLVGVLQRCWHGAVYTHNFFPPARDRNLVINLASKDEVVLERSLEHAERCIDFAAEIGAELYTVHPGFLADAEPGSRREKGRCYDFAFSPERTAHDEAFSRMVDSLKLLLDKATKRGCNLAVETGGSLTRQGVLLLEQPEEYEQFFREIPDGVMLNFNLAHTVFATKVHDFSVSEFVQRFGERFAAVELSHNDGVLDQHLPLIADSYVFDYMDALPNVPLILEFRDVSLDEVRESIRLVREHFRERRGAC